MQDINLTTNIIIWGLIASCYCAHNPAAQMRHTFSPPNLVLIGHDTYTANPDWKEIDGEKLQGVVLVKDINPYSSGPRSREVYFFPFRELDPVEWTLKGLRLE